MNDPTTQTEAPLTPALPDETADATAESSEDPTEDELLERRLERLLEPEHAEQFTHLVSSLPPGEALKTYRAFFTPATERQSLPLVRVSLRKLTQQALVSALPRIAAARPDITRALALSWLDLYADVIEAMLSGLPFPEDVSTNVLSAAQFVLEGELPEGEESSALTTALQRAAQLQSDCAVWEDKHAAAQTEVARLTREVAHLTEKLRRAEARTETAVRQEREHAARHAEREQRRARQTLEASEREIEVRQLRHDQELAAVRKDVKRLELQVLAGDGERSHHLTGLLTRERAESERLRARHAQQLKELHGTITALQAELAAHTEQGEQAFDETLLDDALVISYTGIEDDPVQRLTALFDLYGAFLQGRREHAGLLRHSNISQFKGRQPVGILLLGLEQLLLDGVNIPLTRYLNLKGLRQEAVLHQLIGRLGSPRLTEAS